MQDFKKLKIWQRSHPHAIAIQQMARGFTRAGFAELKSQLTRSAGSVPDTIVEGCGADTKRELARYLDMSIKSSSETEYHLLVARDHHLISPDVWEKFTAETIEIRKMIYVYRKKVLE